MAARKPIALKTFNIIMAGHVASVILVTSSTSTKAAGCSQQKNVQIEAHVWPEGKKKGADKEEEVRGADLAIALQLRGQEGMQSTDISQVVDIAQTVMSCKKGQMLAMYDGMPVM